MIYLLVGTIGSGKSTYAKKMAKDGVLIVNDDSIVNSVHGGQNTLYSMALQPLYKLIENTIIHYAVGNHLDVIIDRTNLSIKSRKRPIAIAKSLEEQITAICFKIPSKEEALNRRMTEDRGYSREQWAKVWDRMMADYSQPTVDEGFDFIWEL